MGLADLHIHTIYSPDGTCTVPAILRYADTKTNLNVIAITDHDQIDGALEALDLAQDYHIEVIPGIEVTSRDGHILALFVTQIIAPRLSLEETVLRAIELGGLCIIPHPMFHNRNCINPQRILRALQIPQVRAGLAGYEAFNAGIGGSQRQTEALFYLKQIPIARVGCSDAHIDWMIGRGATKFPGLTAADLRNALITRQTHAIGESTISMRHYVFRFLPQLLLRHAGFSNERNRLSKRSRNQPEISGNRKIRHSSNGIG